MFFIAFLFRWSPTPSSTRTRFVLHGHKHLAVIWFRLAGDREVFCVFVSPPSMLISFCSLLLLLESSQTAHPTEHRRSKPLLALLHQGLRSTSKQTGTFWGIFSTKFSYPKPTTARVVYVRFVPTESIRAATLLQNSPAASTRFIGVSVAASNHSNT